MLLLIAAAALLVAGGTVFYLLAVLAGRQWRRRPLPAVPAEPPPISVLKPLAGLEPDLERNLASFFASSYPDFELLFAVRQADDPAAAVVAKLMAAHPMAAARLIVAGEPPSIEAYPNAKNWSLLRLAEQARGEILVISDSDIRCAPNDLHALAADFADARVGVVTCPYRAVPGGGPWSLLEAIGMSTEFWGGALTAQYLSPMDFAVGPTMAVRRTCLEAIGGFAATRDYLAEDFVIGQRARRLGWEVKLSRCVVEHHIGSQGFWANLRHRLRWQRSTRRSRPAGYLLQIFTYPLPFALALLWLTDGAAWSWALLALCLAARIAAALSTARLLADSLVPRRLALLPLQDLLSFVVWLLAFYGRTIIWRGRTFELTRQGRLRARPGL